MNQSTGDKKNLEWLLVVNTRRCWTALSVAVLSAVSLVLLTRYRGGFQLPMGFTLGTLTVASGTIWFRAQQAILSTRRALGRHYEWKQLLGS
jgi:hypothetical protein